MTDIARYFKHNPDEQMPHCHNTGDAGDGVIFPGVQAISGRPVFIGRQSIIEAFAEINEMTVEQVKKLMDGSHKAAAQVKAAKEQAKTYEAKAILYDELVAKLSGMLPRVAED